MHGQRAAAGGSVLNRQELCQRTKATSDGEMF